MKKFSLLISILISLHAELQVLSRESLGIKILHSIECTSVKDQYNSSTCWSFASNSFIESELLKKGIRVDLSEMFFARYSYLNKVDKYLATKGKIYFTPGGQFHDVLKVIKQYGMVPEDVYNGRPNGEVNHNHAELDSLMVQYTGVMDLQHKTKPSEEDMQRLNQLLDKYLGKVPETFVYKGKIYTPKTFATEALHFNADDYIEITSYTHHPYTSFILEDKYNWSMDKYYNVPLNDFTAITDSALKNNYSVCWDGDAASKGFEYEKGIAMLPYPVTNFKLIRQKTFEDKTSALDHMMHIVDTAKDKDNHKWYLIKNSWGDYSNKENGYMYMRDDYFKIKTMAIIVNKNAMPAAIRKKMNI